MATIDEDLNQIERDVRTLKIEYEQFFGGGRSRPPTDTQWRVDTLVRRYAERVAELSSGQRFRYNNLTQTYAKYQDLWRKKLLQKEGGVSLRHFGAAARAIEAQRSRENAHRQKAADAEAVAIAARPEHHATPHPADTAVADALPQAKKAREAAAFALSFSDPEHEKPKVQQLYRKLIEARSAAGDTASVPSLKDFERFVLQKTTDLKNKGGHEIEYTVTVEAGRVKLKARISS
ncbi:MAG TPA: MXAN_5187 C-terminal domain-containing protein [Candidatus Acidoferrales bacterium]|nr:MXAN_5187 C-terminal domain-containing protein [Candidatus Acidoferrales bacterium]